MSGLRIFKNGWPHMGCDAFLCNQSPTIWGVGVPDGPPGQHQQFCEADMAELIANLPDDLLPAVGALVRRHVLEGTEFGVDIWERFRALQPGVPGGTNEGSGALVITGGTGADPDPAAQLAAIEATVLQHVTEGTEWGQALVGKIADALPDAVAPDGEIAGISVVDAERPTDNLLVGGENGPCPECMNPEPHRHPPGAPVELTTGDGGEPPVDSEPKPACVCGWTPKAGSTNPDRDLQAHRRFCEAAKAAKGSDA